MIIFGSVSISGSCFSVGFGSGSCFGSRDPGSESTTLFQETYYDSISYFLPAGEVDTLAAVVDTPVGAVDTLVVAVDNPAGAADTRRRRVDTLPETEAGSHRRLARDSTGAALTLLKLFLKKKQKQCSKNNLSRKVPLFSHCLTVLGIRDILVQIRINISTPFREKRRIIY
jgi:hypothetical protein